MRVEMYTYTDFMAICGGLLGLILGISTLSIIEFIYYITLRLFWTVQRSKDHNIVAPFDRRRSISAFLLDKPSNYNYY